MKVKHAALWIVASMVCFFLLGYLTRAVLGNTSKHPESSYLDRLEEDLKLTSDQRSRIGDCLSREDEEIQKLMSSYREPINKELQTIRASTREEIRKMLNEEQLKVFDGGSFFSD